MTQKGKIPLEKILCGVCAHRTHRPRNHGTRHASWCLLSSRNKIVFNDLLFGARLEGMDHESGDDLPRFGLELSGAEAVCI